MFFNKDKKFVKLVKKLEECYLKDATHDYMPAVEDLKYYFINENQKTIKRRVKLFYKHGCNVLVLFFEIQKSLKPNKTRLSGSEMLQFTKAVYNSVLINKNENIYLTLNLVESYFLTEKEKRKLVKDVKGENCVTLFKALLKHPALSVKEENKYITVLAKNIKNTAVKADKINPDIKLLDSVQIIYKEDAAESLVGKFVEIFAASDMSQASVEVFKNVEPLLCSDGVHIRDIALYIQRDYSISKETIEKLSKIYLENAAVISAAPIAEELRAKMYVDEETGSRWVKELYELVEKPEIDFYTQRKLYRSIISLLRNTSVCDETALETLSSALNVLETKRKQVEHCADGPDMLRELTMEGRVGRAAVEDRQNLTCLLAVKNLPASYKETAKQLMSNGYSGWGWDLEETVNFIMENEVKNFTVNANERKNKVKRSKGQQGF